MAFHALLCYFHGLLWSGGGAGYIAMFRIARCHLNIGNGDDPDAAIDGGQIEGLPVTE